MKFLTAAQLELNEGEDNYSRRIEYAVHKIYCKKWETISSKKLIFGLVSTVRNLMRIWYTIAQDLREKGVLVYDIVSVSCYQNIFPVPSGPV